MACSKNVCVIGAGVIGLSTAYCLSKCNANLKVTLISDKFSPHTTGDGAAGKWDPSNYHQTPVEDLR